MKFSFLIIFDKALSQLLDGSSEHLKKSRSYLNWYLRFKSWLRGFAHKNCEQEGYTLEKAY